MSLRRSFHLSYVNGWADLEYMRQLQCCGYFDTTDLVEIGGFCANQTFVDTTINSTEAFCVGPITSFADMTLNNVFRYV